MATYGFLLSIFTCLLGEHTWQAPKFYQFTSPKCPFDTLRFFLRPFGSKLWCWYINQKEKSMKFRIWLERDRWVMALVFFSLWRMVHWRLCPLTSEQHADDHMLRIIEFQKQKRNNSQETVCEPNDTFIWFIWIRFSRTNKFDVLTTNR